MIAVRGWLSSCARAEANLAHCAKARDVNQLRLQLLQTVLALLTRAHVLHEPGEQPAPGRLNLADRELQGKIVPSLRCPALRAQCR